ncbi:TPA: hypothetical protein ACX6RR_001145 [Photobacterium damselae]
MNKLNQHNSSLRELLESTEQTLAHETLSELVNLDSIDLILRDSLSIDEMREAGSFFTGGKLTEFTVSNLNKIKPLTFDSVVIDPTCGAGNLLLGCSRNLGIEVTLSKTLEKWGKVLWGFDIHDAFVEATKLRLIIEALHRGVQRDCSLEVALELLPNIVCRDALKVNADELKDVTHAIMNPPFTICPSPRVDYWKKGKLNSAGIIFDKYLRLLSNDCAISAILPDVLRSGSRYISFREFVEQNMAASCVIWGRFNKKTNVDVFLLYGTSSKSNNIEITWYRKLGDYIKLSDEFDVCTGPLVAYRDPEEGSTYPYFHSKNSNAWTTVTEANEYRKFSGKVLTPPLVIIKRTSSPSDIYRASATLINLKENVAIENHMIVISPKSGKLKDCRSLMKILRSDSTNDFLNDRARMRHLTVKAIKEIPI